MRASVVIRALNEADAIRATLDGLAAQTLEHQLILVDSGSKDGTRMIARGAGAELIDLPREEFTFGRALNLGAAAATSDLVVALSAHAVPPDERWLERMAAHFEDGVVACAYGEVVDETFRPLLTPVRQDADRMERWPFWGYSNAAGAFRTALWRERPFREDMPGTEDREWARWALAGGYVCVLDPSLAVDHDHSKDPLRDCYRRYRREWRGYSMFLDLDPYRVRDLAQEWWSDQGGHRSKGRARLDPRRMARLAGKWRGLRS